MSAGDEQRLEGDCGEYGGMSSASDNIPPDWEWLPLAEFITIAQYGLSKKANADTGVPLLRMTNQENGRITARDLKYVELNEPEKAKFKVEVGDILFNRTNSFDLVGRTAIFDLPGDYVFASYLIRLRTKPEKLLPEFLTLYFIGDATQRRLKSIATRAVSQSNISATRLKGFPIPLPPLPEQKKIAHILSTVQRAIEAQERIIQTTTELKKALMQKLFTEGLRGEKQKETEIGLVPESWEVVEIGDVSAVKGGKRLPKGDKLVERDTGFPYIRVTDFSEFSVDVSGLLFLTGDAQRKISRYIINRDDVFISIAGSIGIPGMIPPELDGANLTENAARLITKDSSQLHPRFLMYWLASHHCQAEIKAQTVKNAQPKLALARIKSLKTPLPPFNEQVDVARTLDMAARKTENVRVKRDQLRELFHTFLHELMTAKVRVHELEMPC